MLAQDYEGIHPSENMLCMYMQYLGNSIILHFHSKNAMLGTILRIRYNLVLASQYYVQGSLIYSKVLLSGSKTMKYILLSVYLLHTYIIMQYYNYMHTV